MLALQGLRQTPESSIPNVLPCRIHHSGPAKVTKRFWSPSQEHGTLTHPSNLQCCMQKFKLISTDSTKVSYFRGRKLRGRTIKLPAGYTGVAAKATELLLPQQPRLSSNKVGAEDSIIDAEDDESDDKPEQVKVLQSTATFNEIIVWGHDVLPGADDPFAKGIEEWTAFAEAIHAETEPQSASTAS